MNIQNRFPKLLISFSLLLALLIFSSQSCGKKEPKQEKLAGTITFIMGKVFINDKPAQMGQKVHAPDIIRTEKKSMARIQFNQVASVTVRSASELVIKQLEQNAAMGTKIRMYQENGSTFHKVVRKSTPDYKVQTPTAVAGVRGTSFEIAMDSQKKGRVRLLSGKLELTRVPPQTGDSKSGQAGDQQDVKSQVVQLTSGQSVETSDQGIVAPTPMSKEEKKDLEVYDQIAMVQTETLQQPEALQKSTEQIMPEKVKQEIIQLENKETIRREKVQEQIKQEEIKKDETNPQSTENKRPAPRKLTLDDLAKKYGKLSSVTTKAGKTYVGAFQQKGGNIIVITPNGEVSIPSTDISKISRYNN